MLTDTSNEHRSTEQAYRLVNEGHTLLDCAKVDLAISAFERAIALHPDFAEAHYNLGVAFGGLHQIDRAAACYQKAIELKGEFVQARYNLANLYKQTGQLDQAVTHYRNTLQIDPDHWKTLSNLGETLRIMGRTKEAVPYLRQAIRLRPDGYQAYVRLGRAWVDQGSLDQAVECFHTALELRPDDAAAHCNLGAALNLAGKYDQAIQQYNLAILIDPDNPESHWNKAILLLQTGRLQEGWKEYAWRRKMPAVMPIAYARTYEQPHWDGSPSTGRRLLVHYEQGLGDTLQFVRYLPMVKAQGGTVLFEAQGPLYRLLRGFPGIDELVAETPGAGPNVSFDLQVSLLDLPAIFGTTLHTIPAAVPYLFAEPDKVVVWKGRAAGPGLKVGLVWAGSPRHTGDSIRSCPLVDLEPLSQIRGVRLYSLQKEVTGPNSDRLQRMDVMPLGDRFEDFSDTAAAVANLDLVISVDTAVLHLAGAMAKPAWALLGYSPDWRWMQDRPDSPWYPSLRLFRQQKGQDWQSVIAQVAAELRVLSSQS